MDTPNLILSMILCVMIGFAIGNVWGKESMKRTFSELMNHLVEGLKMASGKTENKKEE